MNKKDRKNDYVSPIVEVLNARVEAGYQTSVNHDEGNANTTRYGEGSWDSPTPSNGAPQYN